jgi:hypothetical protein
MLGLYLELGTYANNNCRSLGRIAEISEANFIPGKRYGWMITKEYRESSGNAWGVRMRHDGDWRLNLKKEGFGRHGYEGQWPRVWRTRATLAKKNGNPAERGCRYISQILRHRRRGGCIGTIPAGFSSIDTLVGVGFGKRARPAPTGVSVLQKRTWSARPTGCVPLQPCGV